ncbi:MAG TPA: hypothetical protein VIX86_20780 [Streptosporangiaceae bacterium]
MLVHLLLLRLGIAQRQFIRQCPEGMVLNLDKVTNDVSENPVAAALRQLSMKTQPELAQARVRPAVAYDGLAIVEEGPQTGDIVGGGPLRAQAGNGGLDTHPSLDQLLRYPQGDRRGFRAPQPGVDHIHPSAVTDFHRPNEFQGQDRLPGCRPADLRHRSDLPVTGEPAAHRIITAGHGIK